jgi:hypothetical protein
MLSLQSLGEPGKRKATGWATDGSDIESQQGQESSNSPNTETGSGLHPASSKGARVQGPPLTSNWCSGQGNVDVYTLTA